MAFNPNDHITKLPRQAKDPDSGQYITVYDDYLEVKWRLVWFREVYPQGAITTQEVEVDLDRWVEGEFPCVPAIWIDDPDRPGKKKKKTVTKKAQGYARYRAVVTDGLGGHGTGTKTETALGFADFCEKAETGAIGRALAALGFGTQFAPDFNEGERIVDSPVPPSPEKNDEKKSSEPPSSSFPAPAKAKVTPAVPPEPQKPVTSEQLVQISKTCEVTGPYEWKHLLSQAKLSPDTAKWTEAQAKAFLDSANGWEGSPMQKEWAKQAASREQKDEIKAFRQVDAYGEVAVASLKSRIPSIKEVLSTNFTREQADLLLRVLYDARATVARARKSDPQFAIAKALGATHPLDFYCPVNPLDTGLTNYLKRLDEAEQPKAKVA